MRAALLNAWPALSAYGVYPWNFHELSEPELGSYLKAIADRGWNDGR